VELTPVVKPVSRAAWVGPVGLLIAVILVVGLGGLVSVKDGKTDDLGLTGSMVPKGVDVTAKAGSSKVALDIKTDVVEGSRPTHVEITGVGAFDYAAGEGHIDEHLSGATVPPGTPSDVSLLITKVAVFVSGPAVSGKLPAGKSFLEMPIPPPSVVPNSNTTPADTLRILKNVSGPIVKVGREQVRGVDTVHFRTTVDLAKTQGSSQTPTTAGRQSGSDIVPIGLSVNVATEVWLDAAGRVRRMTMTFDVGALTKIFRGGPLNGTSASRVTGTQIVTLELFDFGTAARVTAPPADQVVDQSHARGPGFNFGTKTA
jgi:hypothetical protein